MRKWMMIMSAAALVSCGGGGDDLPDGEACDSGAECESNVCTNGICGDGTANANNGGGGGDPFNCGVSGNATCNPGQYCLVSQLDNQETAAECLAIPDCGSSACGCAEEDAPDNSVNCEGGVVSSSCNNESIVITCNRSSFGF